MDEATAQAGSIRAYFSHSYRKADKKRNLFFWQLFAEAGCYFTVDRKPEKPAPMVISYLEWLMRRSACFIAVVPRREVPPFYCSPYQMFENELAIRVGKPRLIFVQDGLPLQQFRGNEDEVCFFHPDRYAAVDKDLAVKVERLVAKARGEGTVLAQGLHNVPVLLARDTPGAYSPAVIDKLRKAVNSTGVPYGGTIDPFDGFTTLPQFVLSMEQYEAVVTEIRPPYMALDLLAALHDRCIPIIPICHLEPGESAEEIGARLHLPLAMRDDPWDAAVRGQWPMIFSGSQLDEDMAPVIFWQDEDKLAAEVKLRLGKIYDSVKMAPDELRNFEKARQYFLKAGRQDYHIFISNAGSQNNLAAAMSAELRSQGIEHFHYRDLGAIPVGTSNWLRKVYEEIDRAQLFVMLLDKEYVKSPYCVAELQRAKMNLETGRNLIFPYIVEKMDWPEHELGMLQGNDLTRYPEERWVPTMVDEITEFLESDEERGRRLAPRQETAQADAGSGAEIEELPEIVPAHEVRIVVDLVHRKVGTFSAIDGARLVDIQTARTALGAGWIGLLSREAGGSPAWPVSMEEVGAELNRKILGKKGAISRLYQELWDKAGHHPTLLRFCFASDQSGLALPFEWMHNPSGQPIAVQHPVRRFITGAVPPRPALAQLRRSEQRILLIAADTAGIPQVDREIDDIAQQFEAVGVPKANIYALHSAAAHYAEVKKQIMQGGFHLLHFASHGDAGGEQEAFLAVRSRAEGQDVARIEASALRDWVKDSPVRFVYLSTCLGAGSAAAPTFTAARFNPIHTLAGALVEAGVPEVVAFRWPILDEDSRVMARSFYQAYAKRRDAAAALLEARRGSAEKNTQIWAATILVQQF